MKHTPKSPLKRGLFDAFCLNEFFVIEETNQGLGEGSRFGGWGVMGFGVVV